MKIIGLCGGSGSGKGTVAAMFLRHGIPSVDTDKVYHAITSKTTPCTLELVAEFGDSILNIDGSLNRKALARIVFESGNETKLNRLNSITHRHILNTTREILEEYKSSGVRAALVDAPLLFESHFNEECDEIIAVIADMDVRISRIIERDHVDRTAAMTRISKQLSDEYLREHSDHIIVNNGSLCETEKEVARIAEKILNK